MRHPEKNVWICHVFLWGLCFRSWPLWLCCVVLVGKPSQSPWKQLASFSTPRPLQLGSEVGTSYKAYESWSCRKNMEKPKNFQIIDHQGQTLYFLPLSNLPISSNKMRVCSQHRRRPKWLAFAEGCELQAIPVDWRCWIWHPKTTCSCDAGALFVFRRCQLEATSGVAKKIWKKHLEIWGFQERYLGKSHLRGSIGSRLCHFSREQCPSFDQGQCTTRGLWLGEGHQQGRWPVGFLRAQLLRFPRWVALVGWEVGLPIPRGVWRDGSQKRGGAQFGHEIGGRPPIFQLGKAPTLCGWNSPSLELPNFLTHTTSVRVLNWTCLSLASRRSMATPTRRREILHQFGPVLNCPTGKDLQAYCQRCEVQGRTCGRSLLEIFWKLLEYVYIGELDLDLIEIIVCSVHRESQVFGSSLCLSVPPLLVEM